MSDRTPGIGATFTDAWLVEGVRTPFADYNGAFAAISPTDLGIKVGREVLKRAGAKGEDIDTVITGNMAQASFDVFCLPRHVALYSGAPIHTPAHHVQRVCGTGIEVLSQGADAVSLGRADLALCVGTESMSRNPVASYTARGGFRLGQVEFKDFLWEALLDPGKTQKFDVKLYDAKGEFVRNAEPASVQWAVDQLQGTVAADGTYSAPASGGRNTTRLVRIFSPVAPTSLLPLPTRSFTPSVISRIFLIDV